MEITAENLDIIYRQASTQFSAALQGTPTFYDQICTVVPMGTRQLTNTWLDRIPQLKRWVGPRVVNNVFAHSRTITALPYEDTIALDKFDIEDDQLGLFIMGVQGLGEAAKKWADNITAKFIQDEASVVLGYDGVPVYSTAHPLLGGVDGGLPAGAPATQSNLFVNTPLTYDNYRMVRAAMGAWVGADGAPLMAAPDVLMVPPQLEGQAKLILESDFLAQGALTSTSNAPTTNIWKGSAKILVNPWLAGMPNNWWLLDTRSVIKPFAHYLRTAPIMTALTNPNDPNVFFNHQFIWGVEARGAASETVWWLSAAATSEADYIPA